MPVAILSIISLLWQLMLTVSEEYVAGDHRDPALTRATL